MPSIFVPKTRHVVPSFRRFSDTVALGEIAPATLTRVAPSIDFDSLVAQWKQGPNAGVAGDLISAALVAGSTDFPEVSEAAEFILKNEDKSSHVLIATATKLMTATVQDAPERHQLSRLEDFFDAHSREKAYERIHKLRQATIRFGHDPILFTELARLYLITGNPEKAKRNMRIALALAPSNRFVLRSAARLYAHYDDSERAYDLLRRFPGTRHDPWLASAELAVAGLVGRETNVVKKASSLLSKDLSPFSTAELRTGLGSVELRHGSRRRVKQLFREALSAPNDNSLAQTEWALSVDRFFEFDPKTFDVRRNSEALALDAFNDQKWPDVLKYCESWFLDMPFSSRPVMMAAHVASSILDDQVAAQAFCRAGLVSQPDDEGLVNNYAYALALDDKSHEAITVLDQIHLSSVENLNNRACLVATRGLAHYRNGQINEGRALYLQAIELAQDQGFRQLALLNYVREELLAKQPVETAVIEAIRKIKTEPNAVALRLLINRVIELHEKSSSEIQQVRTR
jgi:Tfp pilus assembly protein PilF